MRNAEPGIMILSSSVYFVTVVELEMRMTRGRERG